MSTRRLRRYINALLAGKRPTAFRADEEDAGMLRAAITLRAARPGSGMPSEEFVTGLRRRLAAELDDAPAPAPRPTRRRLVLWTSAAAATAAAGAAVGATVQNELSQRPGPPPELRPNAGTWRTVATSAELPDGAVKPFDLGAVNGFVRRTGGRLSAVSGVCTHLGCRLALDQPRRELACPCHNAAFDLDGTLVRHQLRKAPAPLPRLVVREVDGAVQVLAPA
jgi:nitrite reductase/ring-hydroxylating ferredoxin subunit